MSSIGSDFAFQKINLTSLANNASYSFSTVHVYILWCNIIVKCHFSFCTKLFILGHFYYSWEKSITSYTNIKLLLLIFTKYVVSGNARFLEIFPIIRFQISSLVVIHCLYESDYYFMNSVNIQSLNLLLSHAPYVYYYCCYHYYYFMHVVYKSAHEVNLKHYTGVLATGISHYLLDQYTMLLYCSNLMNTKMKF